MAEEGDPIFTEVARVAVPTVQRSPAKKNVSASAIGLGAELTPGNTGTLGTRRKSLPPEGSTYDDLHSAIGTLESKIWFHGELSRDGTQDRLMDNTGRGSMRRDGYFLVRRGRAGLILSVLEHMEIKHYIITEHMRSGISCYSIDDGPRFPSVPGLISFYRASPEPLPIKLRAHCPNKSVASPHVMFGSYGVAWMATGKHADEEEARAEAECAQKIYDQEKKEMKAATPSAPKNKFAAAARAIVAAKHMSWQARAEKIMDTIGADDLKDDEPVNEKTAKFNRYRATVKHSTLVESKLYLSWLNKKLETIDKHVDNLAADLQTGVIVIDLIHMLTGCKKPVHQARPSSDVLMQDNWHAVLKYMKRANLSTKGLDAEALFKLDQRVILKLFSMLMTWETKQSLKNEAS